MPLCKEDTCKDACGRKQKMPDPQGIKDRRGQANKQGRNIDGILTYSHVGLANNRHVVRNQRKRPVISIKEDTMQKESVEQLPAPRTFIPSPKREKRRQSQGGLSIFGDLKILLRDIHGHWRFGVLAAPCDRRSPHVVRMSTPKIPQKTFNRRLTCGPHVQHAARMWPPHVYFKDLIV
ncbi:hypothetical protein RND71_036810 [Anisodus tanguticus]|uniref:Uncharacterized protein n=1 Tax=Anisodus tanguticus TaxID=243964 RepID=A0AAE1R2G4_9SOLA|nr:hypothetical protein RND71_036810 [Anisodus tanguticus]